MRSFQEVNTDGTGLQVEYDYITVYITSKVRAHQIKLLVALGCLHDGDTSDAGCGNDEHSAVGAADGVLPQVAMVANFFFLISKTRYRAETI